MYRSMLQNCIFQKQRNGYWNHQKNLVITYIYINSYTVIISKFYNSLPYKRIIFNGCFKLKLSMLHRKLGILLDISNNIVLCQHFHCSIPLKFLFNMRKNYLLTNPFYMKLFLVLTKSFHLNTAPEVIQFSFPWHLHNVLAGGLGLFLSGLW